MEIVRMTKSEPYINYFNQILYILKLIVNDSNNNLRNYKKKKDFEFNENFNDKTKIKLKNEKSKLISILKKLKCDNLENIFVFLKKLSKLTYFTNIKISLEDTDYLEFLLKYIVSYGNKTSPIESIKLLLKDKSNSIPWEPGVEKILKIVFFQKKFTRISFYELSLLNTILNKFKDDPYINRIFFMVSYDFIFSLCSKFVCGRNYIVNKTFINSFLKNIINILTELKYITEEFNLNWESMEKVIFTVMIFHLKNNSIFAKNFTDSELFYCCILEYNNHLNIKKLQEYMKYKLFWFFKCENLGYTLDFLYRTMYKYEFMKFIENVIKRREQSLLFVNKKLKEFLISEIGIDSSPFNTSIITETPKKKELIQKEYFSPFSPLIKRKITNNDNLKSQKKIFFD